MKVPQFCQDCGGELQSIQTTSGWEAKGECKKCGAQYTLSYGDAMGGSSDVIEWTNLKPIKKPRRTKS